MFGMIFLKLRTINKNIYNTLRDLDSCDNDWILDADKGIEEAEKELGFKLSDEQKEIIKEAVNHNVVVISGKAGSGKTTISRALLKIFLISGETLGSSIAAIASSGASVPFRIPSER